jgi:hypothetical protein
MTGWRKRQVLELALEALETAEIDGNCEYGATEIIRKALAQPEQRTWVGLTDGVMCDIAIKHGLMSIDWIDFARAIEAKLKEKNFD